MGTIMRGNSKKEEYFKEMVFFTTLKDKCYIEGLGWMDCLMDMENHITRKRTRLESTWGTSIRIPKIG